MQRDNKPQIDRGIHSPTASTPLCDRRKFLSGLSLGAALGGTVQSFDVLAAVPGNDKAHGGKKVAQSASEHARLETHPPEVFKLPRFLPQKSGNFDLANPVDNHLAFAKAQANVAGEYSWVAKYGWMLIAPPGKPAYPFLGRMTLTKIFVTPADPALAPNVGPNDFMMWGTFTMTHFDPRNFKPVSRLMNPYNGKTIDAPTVQYADRLIYRMGQSIVVPGVDPKFYDQPWDRQGGYSPHFIDGGQTVSYTVLGSSQFDGPHQPRCDVGFWTVNKAELMDPSKRSIDTHHDYSVIQKMSEYSWFGAEKGDPAQVFVHETGFKTQDVSKIPGIVKTGILERFRGRYL